MRLALCLAALLLVPAALAQKPGDAPAPDGLVTTPGFPPDGIPGQAAGDAFGISTQFAGDVNGDGHVDFIVGAPNNDANGSNAGRAYVYFGGTTADTVPDVVLNGNAANDLFGIAVAGAGDINADGYDDIIVGANLSDAAGTNSGQAYVYFGGVGMTGVPDLILTGPAADDQLGISVSAAGDVNGDGYADVIVGALTSDLGGTNSGAAYLYFGGAIPNATADLTLTGEAAQDFFGGSVAGAGDVNGDGFDDVLVGARQNDASGSNSGRAYLYLGGTSPNSVADLVLDGAAMSDQFGRAVTGAGDMNADGFDDFAVGAPYNDAAGTDAGRVTIYLGSAIPDAVADFTVDGMSVGDQLGESLASAGDVNGDAYGDLVIGAPFSDAGGTDAGRLVVVFGAAQPSGMNRYGVVVIGQEPGARLGRAVASGADIDGDGLPDLLVGADVAVTANGASGAVRVLSNTNTGAGVAEWRALGEAAGDGFGTTVASAGDFNGDGYDDVIVGATGSSGHVYVYFGSPTGLSHLPGLVLSGEASGDAFGHSVAGGGDINGDGYDDVIVGAPYNDGGSSSDYQQGRAYLFYGAATPDPVADMVFTGESVNDELGYAVAIIGDRNGDAYDDFVIGVPGYASGSYPEDMGAVFEYFGGPDLDPAIRGFNHNPSGKQNDRFGGALDGAGDANGDGLADYIVGNGRSSSAGGVDDRVYLFTVGRTTFVSESVVSAFGKSVAGIGDYNNDGFDDVIVSAHLHSFGSGNYGQSYIYYGGSIVDSVPDEIITGAHPYMRAGLVVLGAGDVNGDGIADLAITESDFFADKAWVNVFYGGAASSATPDLTFAHPEANAAFGDAAARAGDTNGDGRSDLIVGAPYVNSQGSNSNVGAAYLFRATGPAAAPSLYRLADEPGDQGGWLDLRWTRSDQETQGNASSYLVERSHSPGTTGYAWEPIATIPGTSNPRYSTSVATYSDMTGTNPATTCFRVTALGDAGELWRSIVKCGNSIDNLAPGAPDQLVADESPDGDVLITVDALASPPPDLAGYRITRSADAVCDASDTEVGIAPDDGSAFASLEDDATDFGTDVWYCATAVDVHGNESGYVGAVSANPAVLAAVKVVLQGAYQSGLPAGALMRTDIEDALPLTQPYGAAPWSHGGSEAIDPTDVAPANGRPDVLDDNAIVDWVLVEIRSSTNSTDGKRAAALLLADGTLLDPSTGSAYASVRPAAPGSYHIAVYHRNHVAAMTAFDIGLDSDGPNTLYDLSASPLFVYGTNAVANLGGLYGLFAGDGDGNGNVLADDRQAIWLPTVGQTGYLGGDFNLDSNVLADDRQSLWAPNVGRQSAVPGASLRPTGEVVQERSE